MLMICSGYNVQMAPYYNYYLYILPIWLVFTLDNMQEQSDRKRRNNKIKIASGSLQPRTGYLHSQLVSTSFEAIMFVSVH